MKDNTDSYNEAACLYFNNKMLMIINKLNKSIYKLWGNIYIHWLNKQTAIDISLSLSKIFPKVSNVVFDLTWL